MTIRRAVTARSVAVATFMPAAGLADAGGGQHPLALDLDHAGAAVAVGAVARLGQPAQMRDVDALALRHLPDGLARRASTSRPSRVKRMGSVMGQASRGGRR